MNPSETTRESGVDEGKATCGKKSPSHPHQNDNRKHHHYHHKKSKAPHPAVKHGETRSLVNDVNAPPQSNSNEAKGTLEAETGATPFQIPKVSADARESKELRFNSLV
jgi:hypothetical protein